MSATHLSLFLWPHRVLWKKMMVSRPVTVRTQVKPSCFIYSIKQSVISHSNIFSTSNIFKNMKMCCFCQCTCISKQHLSIVSINRKMCTVPHEFLHHLFLFYFISGVLLSSVVSLNPEKPPFMLILNARTMEEIARAEVDTSFHVCLHGCFIPQKESS